MYICNTCQEECEFDETLVVEQEEFWGEVSTRELYFYDSKCCGDDVTEVEVHEDDE